MKVMLLTAFVAFTSLAHAGYMPPPIKSPFKDFTELNKKIERIFNNQVTEEVVVGTYWDLFNDVKNYLCIKEELVTNDAELLKFVTELHARVPFNKLKLAAVAGNIHRGINATLSNCAPEVQEATYNFLKKHNLYVETEMPVIAIGSNEGPSAEAILNIKYLNETTAANVGLVITQTFIRQVWGPRKVIKGAQNIIHINKPGMEQQNLTLPTIEDYNYPQIRHTGIEEEIKSIQIYKHQNKIALLVYNTEGIASIWTADAQKLNAWKLVAVANPSLFIDAKLDELIGGNLGYASFSATTSKLALDREGRVYLVSFGLDGIYRPGAWKVHRVENF